MAQDTASQRGPIESKPVQREGFERHGQPILMDEEMFQRLLAAIAQRQSAFSLPPPTAGQQALLDGFRNVAQAMGVSDFFVAPAPTVRCGSTVAIHPPQKTKTIRVFFQRGVRDFPVQWDKPLFLDKIPDSDRIGRVEYLDDRGTVLAFTGGEVRELNDKQG